jgi:YbbR domain-containing protein
MRSFRGNALWFVTSIALAFMVWLVATLQVDPVRVAVFNNVPINLIENDAMILANRSTLRRTVSVSVRARDSVLQLMTPDDLTVRADVSNLPPGTHPVRLDVTTPRRATVDTRPAQITVVLELKQARQKPVVLEIVGEPPPGYTRGEPELSSTQVLVTGTLAQVDRVAALRATVDLSDRRTRFVDDVPIVPVSEAGTILNDVTVEQQSVNVSIDVRQREDVVSVALRPVIDFDSAPEGYAVRLDTYVPLSATVRGSPAALALLPDLLDTATIDLTGRTESFTITVATILPEALSSGQVTLLEGETVEVRVVVEAQLAQTQFDNVPVTVTGAAQGQVARVIPSRVTVLVTGPQPMIDELTADDLLVTIDVDGLELGTYDLQPRAALEVNDRPVDEVRVIPGTVGVIVESSPE